MKVYQAINAVQRALSKEGISKDRMASGFGAGYAFRGIDDVYNTLSPLLSEHGLVIIPRCVERHESQRQSGPKTLYFVVVKMEFDFVSAEDGSKHTACTYGEAMDSGDKATNKAMSIAYKYACFQTFAIPTEGDNDPDATIHEPAPNRKPSQKPVKHTVQSNVQGNPQSSEAAKTLPSILADIQKAIDVTALAAIRDYVAARQYSDVDIGEIKMALKSRHDNLVHRKV
ncbi:MAG: single-stranded DNA-binding protein [Moraxellaceae bacterium]|nr:MAG: single-stranded DNA-binding protein [Moraxellaceae bacterium]